MLQLFSCITRHTGTATPMNSLIWNLLYLFEYSFSISSTIAHSEFFFTSISPIVEPGSTLVCSMATRGRTLAVRHGYEDSRGTKFNTPPGGGDDQRSYGAYTVRQGN